CLSRKRAMRSALFRPIPGSWLMARTACSRWRDEIVWDIWNKFIYKFPNPCCRVFRLQEHGDRILQEQAEGLQEFGPGGPVDDPVIARHGDLHHFRRGYLTVLQTEFFIDRADGQDAGVGWVDDGGEFFNAEHTEIGHGEGIALHLLGLEFFLAGFVGQGADELADIAQAHAVGPKQHGYEEALVHGNGHADIDVLVDPDLIPEPGRIDHGVLAQGKRAGL